MKLLLPTLFLGLLSFHSYSQCTPDPSETQPGIHPTQAEGLSPATVGIPYSQTLTVIIPSDTTIDVFGTPTVVPITSAEVTNVTGLPTGFTYACNVSSCVFPGGSTNCAVLTGTATAGQEGSYPLSIYVTYTAGFITQDDIVTGYTLVVNPVSVEEMNNVVALNVSPNPFTTNASVDFYAPSNGAMIVKVYNLLGKIIHEEKIIANQGVNNYVFKGSNLNPGAYLIEISNGKTKTTSRLIKD